MSFLLDTNVVSELRKPTAHPNVASWSAQASGEKAYLSALVVGEIRSGIERLRRRGDDPQADVIEDWLASLRKAFEGLILPVSDEVAEQWGRIDAMKSIPPVDALMAATALEHDLTLVTRDTAPLAETGVRLLNPWLT